MHAHYVQSRTSILSWKLFQAMLAGSAPRVVTAATHQAALQVTFSDKTMSANFFHEEWGSRLGQGLNENHTARCKRMLCELVSSISAADFKILHYKFSFNIVSELFHVRWIHWRKCQARMTLAQDLHRIKRLKINCFSFLVSTLYYTRKRKNDL